MTAETFEKPFQVFTTELHGGQRLEADHPGAIFRQGGVAFFFAPGTIPVLFDHDSVNQIFGAPANTEFQEKS